MDSLMGIPPTYLGLLAIFGGVVVIVLSIGWMYDVTFGLWREHLTVVQERNPFTTYKSVSYTHQTLPTILLV